jgi:Tfp pilus assembly protein PilZ
MIWTNAMVYFPFVYLLFVGLAFQMTWKGIGNIFLSPTYYMVSFLWILIGWALRRARKWAWYVLIIAMIITLYLSSMIAVNYSESSNKWVAYFLAVFIMLHIFLVVRREMIVPYLFPRVRWWEFGIAGMNFIDVQVWSRPAAKERGQLLDITTKGCFIKTPQLYKQGEPIEVVGQAYGHDFRLRGRVVWLAKSTVTHPRGIGVQFGDLEKSERRKVKWITAKLRRERAALAFDVEDIKYALQAKNKQGPASE